MTGRRWRRRAFWWGFGLLGLGFWVSFYVYYVGRERRAVEHAQAFLIRSNYPAASFSARRALLINSNSVGACQIMAELGERFHLPQALAWRQRVATLQPESDSNQLALARTALRIKQPALARHALACIPNSRKQTNAAYHVLAAEGALLAQDFDKAREHLKSAITCDPTNRLHSYNLAILALHSGNTNAVRSERDFLEQHKNDPAYGATILRALADDALNRNQLRHALETSSLLQDRPDVKIEDRLYHLSLLHRLSKEAPDEAEDAIASGLVAAPGSEPRVSDDRESPSAARHRRLNEFILRAQRECCKDPGQVALLGRWLIEHDLVTTALPWLESLPNEVRNVRSVRLAEAECYLVSKNWRELGTQLGNAQWGSDDHLRHAILALSYRQQGEERLARVEWKRAVQAGRDGYAATLNSQALVRLAGAWAWEREAEELLWDLVSDGADAGWALAVLRHSYEIGGNTHGLLRVFTAALRHDADDTVAQNNLAATSLLLGTNLVTAHRVARELHLDHPTNAAVACTYAFSLHLQGRTGEALEIMSNFRGDIRRNPSAAVYYALLLAAQGAVGEAEKYLALAKAGYLLPEERAMLEKLRKR